MPRRLVEGRHPGSAGLGRTAAGRGGDLRDLGDGFAVKRRLMAQFKDVMPADGSYPNSLEDIGKRGDMYSKDARDARSSLAIH